MGKRGFKLVFRDLFRWDTQNGLRGFLDCLRVVYANYVRVSAEKIATVFCFLRVFHDIEGVDWEYTPVYGGFLEKSEVPKRASGRFLRCRKCQGVRFAGSDAARRLSFFRKIGFAIKKTKG